MTRHTWKSACSSLLLMCSLTAFAAAAPYQDVVFTLEPTYYYQLNETSHLDGARDSMGNVSNGIFKGDYINGPPQVGVPGPLTINETIPVPGVGGVANLAHASNNAGHIDLGLSDFFGASAMTVALFAKAGPAAGGDRLFTNNLTDPTRSFQVNVGNDGLVVAVDPSQAGQNAERTLYLPDGSGPDRGLTQASTGWYHVVASTHGATGAERAANISVWINGENRTDDMTVTNWGWGVDTNQAKIGGRRENPADSTTHSGAQDEVAIWLGRTLTDAEVTALWAAALTEPAPDCDINNDTSCDITDLDLLQAGLGGDDREMDLDESGVVDIRDRNLWLEQAGNQTIGRPYLAGDINLDGAVDELDYFTWRPNVFTESINWSDGDFTADGNVDGQDFNLWNANKNAAAAGITATVPEPATGCLAVFALALGAATRRRRG